MKPSSSPTEKGAAPGHHKIGEVLEGLRKRFERAMEFVIVVLMVILAVEVTVGLTFRELGSALVWYDEVASVLLAWLTYLGAVLAALKRSHIGFPEVVRALPPGPRVALTCVAEAFVFGFFALLAWVGWEVLGVLATDTLVTLPQVSVMYTQSIIPISAVLFVIAEALSLPRILHEARHGAAKSGLELTH